MNRLKLTKDRIKSFARSMVSDSSMGVGSKYFKAKNELLKYGDESLHGSNPYMPGTQYFDERVKKEKNGDSSLQPSSKPYVRKNYTSL